MKHATKDFRVVGAVACCGVALLCAAAGCQSKSAPLSDAEKANFQGGPMPEDVRKQMEEHNRKMQQERMRAPGGEQPTAPAAAAPPR